MSEDCLKDLGILNIVLYPYCTSYKSTLGILNAIKSIIVVQSKVRLSKLNWS